MHGCFIISISEHFVHIHSLRECKSMQKILFKHFLQNTPIHTFRNRKEWSHVFKIHFVQTIQE